VVEDKDLEVGPRGRELFSWTTTLSLETCRCLWDLALRHLRDIMTWCLLTQSRTSYTTQQAIKL